MNLDHVFSLPTLTTTLIVLVLLSAFFSATETSMMAVNRYKLRHLAKDHNNAAAKQVLKLLERTDRLLTVILMGNTIANIFASAVATLIGAQLYGEKGVLVATIALTGVVLILAEIGPKTITARYPQGFALFAAFPLHFILFILYPFVWLGNTTVRILLAPFRINITQAKREELTAKELKHIFKETDASVTAEDEQMLTRILELDDVSVQDILVPRADIVGINLDDDWITIYKQLVTSHYTRLPLYKKNLENIYGILHLRDVLHAVSENKLTKQSLIKLATEAHYVPEITRLDQQLLNFKKTKTRLAMVVDEYGEIHGLITLEDILEEIVGDFTTNVAETTETDIIAQADGTYIIDGSVTIRTLNRQLQLHLPMHLGKTINGLIIAYLDYIPTNGLCVKIKNYRLEIVKVTDNVIKTIKLLPQ